MAHNVTLPRNSGLFGTFKSYAELGLKKNIQQHDSNLIERAGNAILWTVEDLPREIYKAVANPKVITVALTAMGLYSNSLAFYASETIALTKWAFEVLPLPGLELLRFGSYLFICALIIGAGMRAYGRFSNETLMATFEGKNQPVAQSMTQTPASGKR
ncbi:MAG: hypothetical protein Q8L98_02335 [Chlamydiales bacterium]|nr:hypothetical protein [Chlamydiales bacterium]